MPQLYQDEPEPFWGFVEIPAGPFVMGSQSGDRKASENESGNPPSLEIPYTCWMARYPVTVAQFQAFVRDHGYDERIWWTETGWAWRNGKWNSRDAWGDDQAGRAQPPNLVRGHTVRPPGSRGAPMQWEEQCHYPNRPVSGVCWFEVMAYCKWLDAQWRVRSSGASIPRRYLVRLPTEAEWEKAARSGDARYYPWGDLSGDEERASLPGRLGHTTTVGMYPRGATPLGLHEMSGNVWEWTLSLDRPYPYNPLDGRNEPAAEGERVIRGGTWAGIQRVARCAYRAKSRPDECDDATGFRMAVSLARAPF
jgi:formylglycine-generating enzyme required for sulfatase activity